jgi:REP element-mobilizing transposase RayT
VVSRVVDRQRVFGEEEKGQFVAFMRLYERLCGVRVLTYCVMSNHFHLLLEVPRKPETPLTEDELIGVVRMRAAA